MINITGINNPIEYKQENVSTFHAVNTRTSLRSTCMELTVSPLAPGGPGCPAGPGRPCHE